MNPAKATVVILAAGRGSRLSPHTDDRPKCLVDVGGTTPLDLCLDALDRSDRVAEVRIVVGHARERIAERLAARRDRHPVREVENPRFDSANNLVSTVFVRDLAGRPFLIVNSDVVCHPRILLDALEESADALVVDPAHPPREEAMKVRYRDGRLEAIGKQLDPATSAGEYIGIARFSAAGGIAFFAAADGLLGAGGDQEWYEAAIEIAAARHPFGRRSTDGLPWIEIDDPADLDRARAEILPRIRRDS
jgi:L-glutamine-phosphate cytidylyltransferase